MDKKQLDYERVMANRRIIRDYRKAVLRWRNKEGIRVETRQEIIRELRKSILSLMHYNRMTRGVLRYRQRKRIEWLRHEMTLKSKLGRSRCLTLLVIDTVSKGRGDW